MIILNAEVEKQLIKEAKKYSEDEFELYCSEAGWQDWMDEFTEAKDGEEISFLEAEEIQEKQKEIFDKAQEERKKDYGNDVTDDFIEEQSAEQTEHKRRFSR